MASQVRPGLTQPDTPKGLQQSAFFFRRRPAYSIRARDLASHSQAGCMGAVSSRDNQNRQKTLGTVGASMYGGIGTQPKSEIPKISGVFSLISVPSRGASQINSLRFFPVNLLRCSSVCNCPLVATSNPNAGRGFDLAPRHRVLAVAGG
jgi:hypothetical protein